MASATRIGIMPMRSAGSGRLPQAAASAVDSRAVVTWILGYSPNGNRRIPELGGGRRDTRSGLGAGAPPWCQRIWCTTKSIEETVAGLDL
jgi:hypothetical protein